MSNYTQTTSFGPKDALPSNDPNKTIYGAAFDTEFGNIATAIASKPDPGTTASFLNVAVTGSAVPANGIYLPAAGTLGFAANAGTVLGTLSAAGLTMPSFVPSSATVPTNGMYLSAANTLAFATNTTARASVNATGNWSIAAPSAGIALSVAGLPGAASNPTILSLTQSGNGTSLTVNSAGGAGSFLQNANAGDSIIRAEAHNLGLGTASGGSTFIASGTNLAAVFGSNGNVTIGPPVSGLALSVSGISDFNGASSGSSYVQLRQNGTIYGNLGCSAALIAGGASTDVALAAATGGGFVLGVNANVKVLAATSAGNVAVSAPSSGVALTVNAVSGTHSTQIADSANNKLNAGFLEVPPNAQTLSYTCVLSDSGKSIDMNGNLLTVTIPANASVAYPVGTTLTFTNLNASNLSIAITTDTMTKAGSTTTGTRTLSQNGVATARKVGTTSWIISGTGLT